MGDTLHLHHVGIAVPDIASAANRYRDRYGYEHASEPIHDPAQQAYVQFFRLPGDQTLSGAGGAGRAGQQAERGS